MALIIKGGKRLFPSKKRNRLPVTKNILKEITKEEPFTVTNLNVDTAFNIAWTGFMRLGEITYTATEAKKSIFAETKLPRSDISFEEGDQYATLRLKRSKTDVEHTGVQIILAVTGQQTFLVAVLRRLFIQDPRPPNAPMFKLSSVVFSRQNVFAILKKRITSAGLSESDFSGHSFRKGDAQHAADNGMLDENIQRLGRWKSNAFKLYFTATLETLFNLNLSFQKSVPLAAPREVVSVPLISSKSVEEMKKQTGRNSIYISPYPSLTNHISTLSL